MKFKLENMLFTRPPVLLFELEDRCNMLCPMCSTQRHRKSRFKRLTIDEIKRRVLGQYRFAGGRFLHITGGEPTLSEHLEEVLKYAVRIGLSISLFTNLYQITAERMKQILEIISDSHHRILISHDSVFPEEIKAIRGVDAHYEITKNLKQLLQIKKALNAKTKVVANVVLQETNCQRIADTINFLTRFDLDKIFIGLIHLFGEINELNFHQVTPPCSRENFPALLRAIETIFEMKKNNPRINLSHGDDIERWRRHFSVPTNHQHICRSDKLLFVSRHGDYRGCHQSRVYANIREIGMVDFLKSEYYAEHRRLLTKCNICTSECS
ncbi:MAG: Coenzyme biosynthesis protein [Deltaproteobacteria bacterium]|nr:Coenzyme biosynthesis protein [Deltaproteobacteria bacterium]